MKRVICDTMIWYNIANGTIDISKLKDVQLIATGLNIIEFASSENLMNEYELIKSAIKAFHDFHHQIILYDPWEYLILQHVKVEYKSESRNELKENLKLFEFLIDDLITEEMEDEHELKKLEILIRNFNKPVKDFVKNMNLALSTTREKGKVNYGSRRKFVSHLQSNNNSFIEIILMILDIFADKLKIHKEDLMGKIDWENFELLIHLWDSYYKEKTITSNSKFHENDFFDLLNTAYVGKHDFYWTQEVNPWVRLMKSKEVTKKYIFEL